jgi:hypothetical protein
LLTYIKRIGRKCYRRSSQHYAWEIMDVFTPVVFCGAAATLCAWRISASSLTLVIVHTICEASWSSLFPMHSPLLFLPCSMPVPLPWMTSTSVLTIGTGVAIRFQTSVLSPMILHWRNVVTHV